MRVGQRGLKHILLHPFLAFEEGQKIWNYHFVLNSYNFRNFSDELATSMPLLSSNFSIFLTKNGDS